MTTEKPGKRTGNADKPLEELRGFRRESQERMLAHVAHLEEEYWTQQHPEGNSHSPQPTNGRATFPQNAAAQTGANGRLRGGLDGTIGRPIIPDDVARIVRAWDRRRKLLRERQAVPEQEERWAQAVDARSEEIDPILAQLGNDVYQRVLALLEELETDREQDLYEDTLDFMEHNRRLDLRRKRRTS